MTVNTSNSTDSWLDYGDGMKCSICGSQLVLADGKRTCVDVDELCFGRVVARLDSAVHLPLELVDVTGFETEDLLFQNLQHQKQKRIPLKKWIDE